MPRKISVVHSSDSSVQVSHSDSSSSDSTADDIGMAQGSYAEGRAAAPGSAIRDDDSYDFPLPDTIRPLVGACGSLSVIAGIVLTIIGGISMNRSPDTDIDVARALIGSGGALLALGIGGVLMTRVASSPATSPGANA